MKEERLQKIHDEIYESITEKQERWILLSLAFIEKYGQVRPTEVGVYMGRRKEIASAPVSAALKKVLAMGVVERTRQGVYLQGKNTYTPKFEYEEEFQKQLQAV